MASGWIKMRSGLRTSAKTIAMSRCLTNSPSFKHWLGNASVTSQVVTRVTVCGLLDVWSSLNQTIDDDDCVSFMDIEDIDHISGIPSFGDAMLSVGWISKIEKGLQFPNFKEFNTPEKQRSETLSGAERTRKWRQKRRDVGDENVTKCDGREEKRREEKNTPLNPPRGKPVTVDDLSFPEGMDNPDVREAVSEWLVHKRTIGKGYKQPSHLNRLICKYLEDFGEDGPQRLIDDIQHSAANNFAGIYPASKRPPSGQQKPHRCLPPTAEDLENWTPHG